MNILTCSVFDLFHGEHKKDNVMISDDIKSNLELKLGYLKDKSFEWHYFILR